MGEEKALLNKHQGPNGFSTEASMTKGYSVPVSYHEMVS